MAPKREGKPGRYFSVLKCASENGLSFDVFGRDLTHLEKLVAEGKVQRHGFEETSKLANRRASKVRVVTARVRYKTVDAEGNTDIITAAMPPEMLPGSIAAPRRWRHTSSWGTSARGCRCSDSKTLLTARGSQSIGAHSRDGRSSSATDLPRRSSKRCTCTRFKPRSASRRRDGSLRSAHCKPREGTPAVQEGELPRDARRPRPRPVRISRERKRQNGPSALPWL